MLVDRQRKEEKEGSLLRRPDNHGLPQPKAASAEPLLSPLCDDQPSTDCKKRSLCTKADPSGLECPHFNVCFPTEEAKKEHAKLERKFKRNKNVLEEILRFLDDFLSDGIYNTL
jgi:hypothetical protein